MKVALLINRENFDKYSAWGDAGWEFIYMGNGVPDAVAVIATGAEAIVVDATIKIGPEIISKMPGLKLIHSQGVAFNAIDIDAARSAGVYVCNCAGMNAQPVAEQAVMLILALLKSFRHNEDMVYAGRQMEAKTAYFREGLSELLGSRVGIVGFGAIGRELAARLRPFGCEIFYYEQMGDMGISGASYMPLNELYTSCDIISLHVPVTPETTDMINEETLKLFKPGAILVNTARGELMDHEAVARALISGQLGGLCADTLAPEPFLPDNPIISGLPEEVRRRVALSPHIAGISAGYFARSYEHIRQNIEAVGRGERAKCIVNGL